jgi:REP element-mobilizing transposase RayT
MPDHMHLIIFPIKPIGYCMQEFKKSAARLINQRRGIVGRKIWLDEYHERVIRDDREYAEKVSYIWRNPVKQKLCSTPGEYPYSSASPLVFTDRDKFY